MSAAEIVYTFTVGGALALAVIVAVCLMKRQGSTICRDGTHRRFRPLLPVPRVRPPNPHRQRRQPRKVARRPNHQGDQFTMSNYQLCKLCGLPIHKVLLGWAHDYPAKWLHFVRPR